jgi:hypothetical protein
MTISDNEQSNVILGRIDERLANIECDIRDLKPLIADMERLKTKVEILERAPEYVQTLSNHEARIRNIEDDVATLFSRSWQIVAGVITLVIGAIIGHLKGGN